MRTIYFDNAATTFPKPPIVYDIMDKTYREYGVNAGRGAYKLAREANKIIEETRENLAKLIRFNNPSKVIFSSSATIALNQIIGGLHWNSNDVVYVSPFDHNAIMRPLNYIQKKYNIGIETIPFDPISFQLDLEEMKTRFSQKKPKYIFISHVSNVTGYILPIKIIAEEAKKYNAIVTVDCAQSIGLLDINMNDINIDYLVFAGHKTLYGPFGIAGFIDKSNTVLNPLITGGTGSDSLNLDMPNYYPSMYESSSPNIQAISGLNAAITWLNNTGMQNVREKEMKLTDLLKDGLSDIYGIKLHLPSEKTNSTGIISCTFSDYDSNEIGQYLDENNIAVRTGYHCSPLIHDFLGTKDKGGTVRFSLGYFNNEDEINYLLECLEEL